MLDQGKIRFDLCPSEEDQAEGSGEEEAHARRWVRPSEGGFGIGGGTQSGCVWWSLSCSPTDQSPDLEEVQDGRPGEQISGSPLRRISCSIKDAEKR